MRGYMKYIQSLSYNEFIIFHNLNDSDDALLSAVAVCFE